MWLNCQKFVRGVVRGAWITGPRVRVGTKLLLIEQIALIIFFIAGSHGLIVELTAPTTTDYVSFYAAGSLAADGTPGLAYDRAAHYAAEQRATEPGIPYQFFFYPPVFLLVCAVFSKLPYLVSFIVFQLVTLAGFLLVMRAILRDTYRGWLVAVLGFSAVFWTIGLGQNGFLTVALLGGGLWLLDRRPFAAGLLFGALCYKPHFGLLIPLVLLVSQRWTAILGAAVSLLGLCLLSVAAFGLDVWGQYLDAVLFSRGVYEAGQIDFAGYVTPFGAAMLVGLPVWLAHGVQIVVSLSVAAVVAWIWRRGASLPVRAAALAAGTLLVVPLALLYDLLLLLLAMAWLVRAGRTGGFLPGEKFIFVCAYLVPLALRSVANLALIPLGPLATGAVLVLCVMRTRKELRDGFGAAATERL